MAFISLVSVEALNAVCSASLNPFHPLPELLKDWLTCALHSAMVLLLKPNLLVKPSKSFV